MKLILISIIAFTLSACAHQHTQGKSGKVGKAGGDTVLVCHKGKKTMQLPREAARAHIDHGDHYGSC